MSLDALNIVEVEPGVWSVLVDGRGYTVLVDGGFLVVNGVRIPAPLDPRDWSAGASGAVAGGPQQIFAPMPGRVVRVLVGVGDEVEAGQGIVVVEAMKMQNEMRAERAGKVSSIRAAEGATVAAGDVLATIE
jgi:biotin carboxyl carrier protein